MKKSGVHVKSAKEGAMQKLLGFDKHLDNKRGSRVE